MDVSVPQIQEAIVEIVAGEVVCNGRTGTARVDVHILSRSWILEQHVDVIKVIPEEWMSKRNVQQIVDVPVPPFPKQIVEVI